MEAPAGAVKNKGPIVDPALCRCCRSIKKCRLLNTEYEWMGKKEVYSDMFMDCFGLLLSHLDGAGTECGVCATCVVRLRDATAFRQQVLQAEDAFLSALIHPKEEPMSDRMEVEVKVEPLCESDAPPDGDDGHSDGVPEPPEPTKKRTRVAKGAGAKRLRIAKRIVSKPEKKTKKEQPPDSEAMRYANILAIVNNSYVCPFHNRVSIYYCFYCKDQFTCPAELREHTLRHEPGGSFQSHLEHNKPLKVDVTRVDCRLCPEKIDDIETFKVHALTHDIAIHPITNEFLKFRLTMDNLRCTECDKTFPYFDVLKKHMVEHFGTHICDMCGACFLEPNSLRTHIKSHSKVEKNFPCEVCGKNLKSKYSRYLHVATVHEKKATVNCYKCEATFMSYALRNRHLIEAHADRRTFPCRDCDKVYNRRKTLMEHNRRNHQKVYRHQCDLCDQRFYLPSRLKEHMATHTGERNFRCSLCDKSYPRLQALQEHARGHAARADFHQDYR